MPGQRERPIFKDAGCDSVLPVAHHQLSVTAYSVYPKLASTYAHYEEPSQLQTELKCHSSDDLRLLKCLGAYNRDMRSQ